MAGLGFRPKIVTAMLTRMCYEGCAYEDWGHGSGFEDVGLRWKLHGIPQGAQGVAAGGNTSFIEKR